MKITYIVAIFIYICFIVRIFNRKNYSVLIELILFSIIAAPGIQISGVLVNLFDLIVPLFLAYYILTNKDIYFGKLEIAFLLYDIVAVLSLLINFFDYDKIFSAVLQLVRLFYIPVSAAIFYRLYRTERNGYSVLEVVNSINIYAIYLGIISICAFLEQGTIYDSKQLLWIGSITMSRAGGIFGESSTLGFIFVLLFIVAVFTLRNFEQINVKIYAQISIVLSIICNIISYTRITILSFAICIIAFLISTKINAKKCIIFSLILFALLLIYFTNSFLFSFVNDRVLSIFGLFSNFNNATSGRLDTWTGAFERYLNSSILFGGGYKNNFFGDNNLVMSLTTMGVFGLLAFIYLIVILIKKSISSKSLYLILIMLSIIITSLSCDVLTYYRPMSLVLVLSIFISQNKVVDRLGANFKNLNKFTKSNKARKYEN